MLYKKASNHTEIVGQTKSSVTSGVIGTTTMFSQNDQLYKQTNFSHSSC